MAEQNPRRVGTVIWAALVAGVTMFLGVVLFVVYGLGGGAAMATDARNTTLLLSVAVGLSVVTLAVSWLWAVRMPTSATPSAAVKAGTIPPGPGAAALSRLIVASALCEGSALFSIVALLVTRSAGALVPFALSYVALVAHFPGERHWARLTGVPAGAPRNPMIRG